MPHPHVPDELIGRPFTTAMARAAGLSIKQLQSRAWRRVLRDVYVHVDVPDSTPIRAAAAALVLPPGAVVGYTTAAWLHGADIRPSPFAPVEVIVGRGDQLRRKGLRARSALLERADVTVVAGIPITSPVRTAFDLARQPRRVDAIVGVDAMLNRGGCTLDELSTYAANHPGWRGVAAARQVFVEADAGSQSPMETRMRLALVNAGLPRPRTQVPVCADGLPFAYLDLGYDAWLVGADYDGEPHRDRWRQDLARQERIREYGWWHRRFTALDIGSGWAPVVRDVGRALLAAGWRP